MLVSRCILTFFGDCEEVFFRFRAKTRIVTRALAMTFGLGWVDLEAEHLIYAHLSFEIDRTSQGTIKHCLGSNGGLYQLLFAAPGSQIRPTYIRLDNGVISPSDHAAQCKEHPVKSHAKKSVRRSQKKNMFLIMFLIIISRRSQWGLQVLSYAVVVTATWICY